MVQSKLRLALRPGVHVARESEIEDRPLNPEAIVCLTARGTLGISCKSDRRGLPVKGRARSARGSRSDRPCFYASTRERKGRVMLSMGGLMYYTIFGLALVAAISGFFLLRGRQDKEE
jgi:hypothetical protein